MSRIIWSNRRNSDELMKLHFGTYENMIEELELDENISKLSLADTLHMINDDDLASIMCDFEWLDSKTEGDIIAIADLGFWNGRQHGYQVFKSLKDIFYTDCDYVEFWLDTYNLRSALSHHDGTHYVVYRQLKKELTEQQIENFYDKLTNYEITEENMGYYTRSLKKTIEEGL